MNLVMADGTKGSQVSFDVLAALRVMCDVM
jgi:hypothetical protein